jgi:hypothetical protein
MANRSKVKYHIIIPIDAEKILNKFQLLIMIQPLKKRGIRRVFLNIINAIYENLESTLY